MGRGGSGYILSWRGWWTFCMGGCEWVEVCGGIFWVGGGWRTFLLLGVGEWWWAEEYFG